MPADELPGLIEREHEYVLAEVNPYALDGVEPMDCKVIMCAVNTDEAYAEKHCGAKVSRAC